MSILIGHARGGDPTYAPGDQTLNEVRTQGWYLHSAGWNFVARFKDRTKAHKAALFCRAACVNQRIGYGQTTRNQLRPLARAAGWDATRITKDCNCDCTSFVSVCAEAGGVNMDSAYTWGNAPYSENIRQKLAATGEFEILTDAKYRTSDKYLLEGDILVNEPVATGHAVMVLENGEKASDAAQNAGKTETPATLKTTAGVSVGDTVTFSGSTHYTAANGDRGYAARPGPARVTAIVPGAKHPYHLVHTDGTSTVYGWVNTADMAVPAEQTHTVVWGDTLWALARKYGTTVSDICAANNLKESSIIHPGDKLKIPN